jgi:hypothetical protein
MFAIAFLFIRVLCNCFRSRRQTPIVPHEGADIYLFHENLKVIRSDVYFLVGASCTNLRLASVCFLHGLLT